MKREPFSQKKSLGQNFLIDKSIAEKIVRVLDPSTEDLVLEIGPGMGALTAVLATFPAQVIAVEIDWDAVSSLERKISEKNWGNVTVLPDNFLELSIAKISEKYGKDLRLIGNLPYNISSQILFRVFDNADHVRDCVFMFQKEVGERLVASPHSKAYGILSIFAQIHADVSLAFNVAPEAFSPQPKVWSSVLHFGMKKNATKGIIDYKFFKTLVKRTFMMRRKMLSNSLKSMNIDVPGIPEKFHKFLSRRPEDLSVTDFIELSNALDTQKHVITPL